MGKIFIYFIHALWAYIFSSIPFAILIGKLKGIDILKVGTKNPGAANVAKCIGKPYGFLVAFLDILKSFIPVVFARNYSFIPLLIIVILSIIGHNYSIFLKFKGGRGISTSMGVSLALYPLSFLIAFPILLVFSLLKEIALGMLFFFGIIPLIVLFFEKNISYFCISLIIFFIIIIRRLTVSKSKNAQVLMRRFLWDRD